MPQREHAAHGHVHGVAGKRVVGFAVGQKADYDCIHDNGSDPGVIVDGLQVGQPVIVVVDVKEPVIDKKPVVDLLGLLLKGRFAFRKAADRGHGVKKGQKSCLVLLFGRLLFRQGTAAEQQSKGKDQSGQFMEHRSHLLIPFSGCRETDSSTPAASLRGLS